MVSTNIEDRLKNLPKPTIVIEKSFNDFLSENIEILKTIIPNYQPLESDRYMKLIRVLSLKETQNQIDRNDVIEQLLIATAIGSNLDNIGARFDVFRLQGSKPYAMYEISISTKLSKNVTLPKGLTLTDEAGLFKSFLLSDSIIPAGDEKVSLIFELDTYIDTTDIKTEIITTPLPFVVEAKSLEDFSNGSLAETDERYRLRIVESLGKYSTAGSVGSYVYWTKTADNRIDDVSVLGKKGTLEVNVYLASKSGVDGIMIDRVETALSSEKVRPLGDEVAVYEAEVLEVTLDVIVHTFDLMNMTDITNQINKNFDDYRFFIGQHLTRTDVIKNLQVTGVYKIEVAFEDIKTTTMQIIKIKDIKLNFVKVEP